MKNIFFVLLFLVLGVSFSAASSFNQSFPTEDGFTIKLPNDWIQMPRETLDEFSNFISKSAPNLEKQVYAYGFQLKSDRWFTYPYILIQIKNSGRIPSSELKKTKQIQDAMKKESSKTEDSLKSYISDSELETPIYDEGNHILWQKIKFEVAGMGLIHNLMGLKLTEKGFIQIMGYSVESESEKYDKLYSDVILNTTIDDAIAYKPKLSDSVPFLARIDWTQVASAGIIGGLVAGIISLFNRKKKNASN